MVNKKLLNLLFFLLTTIIIYGCSYKSSNLNDELTNMQVSMQLNSEYKISNFRHFNDEDLLITEIYSSSNGDFLKMTITNNISDIKAYSYISNQIYLLESLFSEYNVPYPGFISNQFRCPDKYRPLISEEVTNESYRVFIHLYSNRRLAYGGCADDILDFAVLLSFIYCYEQKAIYKIEYFTPKENPTSGYEAIVKSFKCLY